MARIRLGEVGGLPRGAPPSLMCTFSWNCRELMRLRTVQDLARTICLLVGDEAGEGIVM